MTADSGDGWCCDNWCYVSDTCEYALASWNEQVTLWYNYDACPDSAIARGAASSSVLHVLSPSTSREWFTFVINLLTRP